MRSGNALGAALIVTLAVAPSPTRADEPSSEGPVADDRLAPPDADDLPYDDPSRLRYGTQLSFSYFNDRDHGVGGGAEGHLGWQFSSDFAIYGTFGAGVGARIDASRAWVLVDVGAMADLTLQNRFQLGLGPVLTWSLNRPNEANPYIGPRARFAWLFAGLGVSEPDRNLDGPRLGVGLAVDYAIEAPTDGTGQWLQSARLSLVVQSF
jgi:hypothetical protein